MLIESVSRFACVALNSGMFYQNRDEQIKFMRALKLSYADRIVRIIASGKASVFLFPESAAALCKYALLYGADDGKVPYDELDRVIRALILTNTLFGEKAGHDPSAGTEAFLVYELRSLLSNSENFSMVADRYYRFFTSDAAASGALLVKEDFNSFYGMTYEDYVAAGFMIATAFLGPRSITQWSEQRLALDFADYFVNLENKDFVQKWLDLYSCTMEEAREALLRSPETYSLADLRPFVDTPLLEVSAGRYVTPYFGFLKNKLGVGLYFALFDRYRSRGDGSEKRFAQLFGAWFETYILELMRDATRERPSVDVFGETAYKTGDGNSKSTDVVVIDGNCAVFIEITKKRFKLDETICELDPKALADDLDAMVIRKAKQLDRSLRDFRSGLYKLDGVDPALIERVFPVILTEQGVPQLISLNARLREKIRDERYLEDCEPLNILSAEDIEGLVWSERGSLDLCGLLARKQANEALRYRDLVTYLYQAEPEKLRPENPDARGVFFSKVVEPYVKRWGLRAPKSE